MSCRPPVRAGQRYELGERSYVVVTVDGPEGPHWPIQLQRTRLSEQDRNDCVAFFDNNRVLRKLESAEQVEAELLAIPLHVEAPWFDRADVREVLL